MKWGTTGILIIFGAFVLLLILNPNISCFGKRIRSPLTPLFRKRQLKKRAEEEAKKKVWVLLNPEIVKKKGERMVEEGCLSVPGYRGEVKRAVTVKVKARNTDGKEIRVTATDDLLAQAIVDRGHGLAHHLLFALAYLGQAHGHSALGQRYADNQGGGEFYPEGGNEPRRWDPNLTGQERLPLE